MTNSNNDQSFEVEKLASNYPKVLTLITCDRDNEYRLVVKSKAINQ